MRQIELLDKSKSNSGSIPTSILKDTKDIVCPYLTDCINSAIFDCNFPDELKKADVSPILKEFDSTSSSNLRPISVLPSTSKIYERILKEQMSRYFKDKLRDILCGFREGYSTQHALIRVIEKWRKCLDTSDIVGTILMDLSKAYDCLPHDLLIAKMAAYGFSINSLCLMYDYLNNRYQTLKIGSIRNSPRKIHVGVPQGSVLGPMLFNIFINDLFLIDVDSEVCNFADDNTIFSCGNELHEIVTALENDLSILFEWFNMQWHGSKPQEISVNVSRSKKEARTAPKYSGQ